MKNMMLMVSAGAVAVGASAVAARGQQVLLSEFRVDQPGADLDEYVELAAAPGTVLDGLTLLVIGDGTGGTGTIEAVIDLDGQVVGPGGLFLAAESTFTLGTPDLVRTLNFENSDNLTFVLVEAFSGSNGLDLDTDDDGALDLQPWSAVLDAVGLVEEPNPPAATEFAYGQVLGFEDVGPDDGAAPGQLFRCSPLGSWSIGPFEMDMDGDGVPDGSDTPGTGNVACPGGTCPPDVNQDGLVNVDDLVAVILDWDTDGSGSNGDVDGSGLVDVDDLVAVILAWGTCPPP